MAWESREYYREGPSYGGGRGLGGSLRFLLPRTRLAMVLIIVNVVIFLAQAFTGPVAMASPLVKWGWLTFADGMAFTQPWRWVTYQYLHGGGGHLFWNMLGVYFFVPVLEQMWGWKKTLIFYTSGGIVAGVTYGLMMLMFFGTMGVGGLVGASGSLLAVIGAIAVIAPEMQVLAMLVIPITMRVLAILYAVLYMLTVIGDRSLSDAAHLGGLAFGAALVFVGRRTGGVFENQRYAWKQRTRRRAAQRERDDEATIDRILQKVHQQGMNSLSWSEKRTLKNATERQRETESARARRAR
jgi:membrane associated rhomboid family serine protease